MLTSGRTQRLQWVSLPLCLHFCPWGEWLYQLAALGARHPTYLQLLPAMDPQFRGKQTFTATQDGWALLFFNSNTPRTTIIFSLLKVTFIVASWSAQLMLKNRTISVSDH